MQSRKLTNVIIGKSSLGNERRFVLQRRCPVSGLSDYVCIQRQSINRTGSFNPQEQLFIFLALCTSACVKPEFRYNNILIQSRNDHSHQVYLSGERSR